jgi:hypothetical protein
MRGVLTILVIALSLVGSGAAFAQSAPAEIVADIYREAVRFDKAKSGLDGAYNDAKFRRRYFTATFRAVADTIDAREKAANAAILDYDPILATNGFFNLTGLDIKTEREDATRARVVARFGVGKERASVVYAMVKEAGEWRVDDVTATPDTDSKDA